MSQNGSAAEPKIEIHKGNDQPDKRYVSWGELTQIHTVETYLPKYNAYIRYLDKIPFDKLAEFQARYMNPERRDPRGFMLAILKYVLVDPVYTEDVVNAVAKADSAVLMDVIGKVTSNKDAEDIQRSLGED